MKIIKNRSQEKEIRHTWSQQNLILKFKLTKSKNDSQQVLENKENTQLKILSSKKK